MKKIIALVSAAFILSACGGRENLKNRIEPISPRSPHAEYHIAEALRKEGFSSTVEISGVHKNNVIVTVYFDSIDKMWASLPNLYDAQRQIFDDVIDVKDELMVNNKEVYFLHQIMPGKEHTVIISPMKNHEILEGVQIMADEVDMQDSIRSYLRRI